MEIMGKGKSYTTFDYVLGFIVMLVGVSLALFIYCKEMGARKDKEIYREFLKNDGQYEEGGRV